MKIDELVVREYGWMVSQSIRLCRNRMDAEDIAGDAVLKILCNAAKYDPGRPFRPWASVIILNTYITRCNRDSLVNFSDVEKISGLASPCDVASMVEMSELLAEIRRCRKHSASVDCVLMYATGFTYEEIAAHYSIPVGTVRSRINYARNILRKAIEKQYVK